MSDAYADAGHAGDFTTFKNRTGDYKAGEVKHAIDHLLHSAGAVPLAVLSLPQEEEIGKDGLPCVSWPSDHLSICVEFAISQQPARSADPLSPDWAAKQGAVCPPAAAPAPTPAPAESPGKGAALQPTKARAVMYALTSGVTCFNFLLRNGIPTLIPFIVEAQGYTSAQAAMLLGGFFPGCERIPCPAAVLWLTACAVWSGQTW